MQPQSSGSAFCCRNSRDVHTSRAISTRGMTRIELLIVVVVIVILAGMILPAGRVKDREYSSMKCVNNLKNIGIAYRIWESDHSEDWPKERGQYPFNISTNHEGSFETRDDIVAQFQVLSNELSTPKIIFCPRLRTTSEATNWTSLNRTNVGYYLGLNSAQSNPKSILGGDIGFTVNKALLKTGINKVSTDAQIAYAMDDMHSGLGNILLGDGSVSRFRNNKWPQYLQDSGSETNLFLLP